jgi:hypothetical protein
MADDTDALFGLILFILFLALLGYAAGGISSAPSTAGTTSGTTQSLPPLAGSKVPSCAGTLEQDQTDTNNTVNLKVWTDPMDAGQKCATASTSSSGPLKVTLAYTAEPTQMVSSTASCPSTPSTAQPPCTASVQVTGTDNYCVSAVAERPGTPYKVTIPRVVEPCMLTVPAMQPASPVPRIPADDLEDEEGY